MKRSFFTLSFLFPLALLSSNSFADTYCPSKGGYIKIGMTTDEVIQACGQPESVQKKRVYPTRNVAAQQLVYNFGEGTGGLGNMTFTTGTNYAGSLMVNMFANKIKDITLNGKSVQGASVCPGGMIKVGDNANVVQNACGNPNIKNHSFQKIPNGKAVNEETWTIKSSDYGPTLTLVFYNGTLQSVK